MSDILPSSVLLADSRLKGLSGGFKPGENQQGPGSVVVVLLVILAFIVVLWFLARLAERRRGQGPTNSPLVLFVTLCRAHGLSWRDCFLLWRLARWHRLKDPARLFLEPERMEPGSGGRTPRIGASRLRDIKARVFAGLAEDEPSKTRAAAAKSQLAKTSDEAAAPVPFPFLASQSTSEQAPIPSEGISTS